MSYVNIVTSDRGWILEKLASELRNRLNYIKFSGVIDDKADVQYYITYSSRLARVSPIEIAYFAHLEPDGEARARFFNVAKAVDHCTTHAQMYAFLLQENGIQDVTAISPGVDLQHFTPKLRIGVVGRTYHTGRKGEHIVAQVMDIPEIEWLFTGDGWPDAGLHLPDHALPDFYRHLDYVLVPALYEGGPMCVVEALACGTEVIAPAVGWVPEFPHLEYQVGDASDLRRVLLAVVEKKRALRQTVLDRTWDTWAESHDRVFQALAQRHDLKLKPLTHAQASPERDRIGLFMHGSEGKSPGGPSVRVPRLARELNQLGLQASVERFLQTELASVDIVHAFNVWDPESALDLIRRAKLAERKVVFSPIFLDLSLRRLWQDELPRIFQDAQTPAALETDLEEFQEKCETARSEVDMASEPVPGFYAAVREMVERSDHVIFLSEREKQRLTEIGAHARHGTVIHNPVDHKLFAGADPALFEAKFGVRDFILCVARQETRKNQLLLMHALRDLDIPLVLIGHAASASYRKLIERYARPNIHVIERLPPNSPLLASAFAAARVSVLPSWAEGAPLVALEAAAAGASLVLSNESGESEYFGDWARYADPASSTSLRHAVLEAYENRRSPETIEQQKIFIAERYNWTRHRDSTREVYRSVSASSSSLSLIPTVEVSSSRTTSFSIVYDVTTSANHKGRWTGVARVEAALALALKLHPRVSSIHFVAWNNKAQSFIEMPFDAIQSGKTSSLLSHYDTIAARPLVLPKNAYYLVPGSGWMQNSGYAEGIVAFKNRYSLRLTPIIHDVIPVRFPFWFNDGYAPVFCHNLAVLLGSADHIMAISQCTKSDIEHFISITQNISIPKIDVFREGDEISPLSMRHKESKIAESLAEATFILCVGAVHQRKNHKLLYDVWVKLAAQMGRRCPKLVIVGGIAWNGHDLARALKGDARVKDHIVILEDVGDDDLSWLYTNCMFTVYPSLYEGWGLPVAESLRHGKFCIASSASSIPEIAPEFVELLDPLDPTAWLAKIQFYAGSKLAREQREAVIAKGYRGFTWLDSADTLIEALAALADVCPLDRLYTPGQVVALSDRIQATRIKRDGWHLTESWGCWTSRPSAQLEFFLPASLEGPIVLVAEVQALLFPGATSETRVLMNGVPIARWFIDHSGLQIRTAIVPEAISGDVRRVWVEFENMSLTPINRVAKSPDQRSVGIGINRIAVASASSVRDAWEYLGTAHDEPRRVRLGIEYNFLKDDKIRGCLQGQWTMNSAWGVFNTDMQPRLSLVVHEAPAEDLTIELFFRSVACEDSSLSLIVLANNVQCGSWSFANDQVQVIRFTVPLAVRRLADPMTIDLVSSDMRSPKALGIGELETKFGFGLVSMNVSGTRPQPRFLLPLVAAEKFMLSAPSRPEAAFDLAGPWHGLEKNGIWSFGAQARLPLKLPSSLRGDVVVWAEINAFGPKNSIVPVRVEANGEPLGWINVAGGNPQNVPILVPRSALHGRRWLALALFSIDASSPYKQGTGADERLLGLRFRSVSVHSAPLLQRDRVASFGVVRMPQPGMVSADPLIQGDWYGIERAGRWARGRGGRIALIADPTLAGKGRLFVLARTVGAAPGTPVRVDVDLRGSTIDSWVFNEDMTALVELEGFSTATARDFESVLELKPAAPRSPRDLGRGNDTRLLGIMVSAIVLVGPDHGPEQAAALFRAAGVNYDIVLDRALATRSASAAIISSMLLRLVTMAPSSQANPLDANITSDNAGFFAEGWFGLEQDGAWSEAGRAQLRLGDALPSGDRVSVRMLARVFGTAVAGAATVELSAGATMLAQLHFASDEFHWITLDIDAATFGDGIPVLTLCRLAPVSPAQADGGADDRLLGVLIRFLQVTSWRAEAETDPVVEVEPA